MSLFIMSLFLSELQVWSEKVEKRVMTTPMDGAKSPSSHDGTPRIDENRNTTKVLLPTRDGDPGISCFLV